MTITQDQVVDYIKNLREEEYEDFILILQYEANSPAEDVLGILKDIKYYEEEGQARKAWADAEFRLHER